MDRCALFVDAGYVLTDGAMAVHGTRRRESVAWDYAGLLQLLSSLATERTGLPLLRCYWYEATVEGRRSAEHDTLADLPGVKVRVAKMRPGRREGVEGEIHRDLTTLARNKAVSDVMVVSAEEDLAQVIADVQDMGMRVTLLYIADDGSRAISRALRQECDDIVEISAARLRPYVELISGAEPPRPDEADAGQLAPRLVMNGNGVIGNGANGNGANGTAAGRPAAYPQPQGRPGPGQQLPVPPAAEQPVRQVPQPVMMESPQADPGKPERADAPADYAPVADFGGSVDYSASVDYGAAAEYATGADHAPAAEQASAADYRPSLDYGPVPDYARPAPVPASAAPQPREDFYAAPVALPGPADDLAGDRDRLAGRPRPDLAAYNPGQPREQYQREGMLRDPAPGDAGDRLQPVPVVPPGSGSAQIRRLPARGPLPGGPGQGQPPLGLPPAPADAGAGQQLGGQQPVGQQPVGQPTGGQPVAPVAPVVPMDPNGMGYAGARGGALGGPRSVVQGPNPNSGPQPIAGPSGTGSQLPPPVPQAQQGPLGPGGQQVPGGQPVGGGQPVPGGPPEAGGQSGPLGLVGSGGYSGGAPGVSLADAVQSAHEEGQAFGESVARDAPALWLEAVLARKPRMPSDLEARLLQGSALPIDFLLHDEVRHALRRGFWDALDRARR
ncbi:MAG TPA: NYN domain-containing protein [Trebonia sp.]|nr:NYN domain-containing protein [Trebonia sp.]